jgi:cytosine/adenosine deaminase-related metal-dependent hydrolase
MTLLIHAALALPAPGKAQTDYAVAVEGGRIVAAGAQAALFAQYPDAERIGGREYFLLPGFINAHDHGRAIGSASLGIPDDMLECWLPMLGAQPHIPPYLAAAYDAIQQLKSGITGTAHSHNPATWAGMAEECHESIRGYREAGIRVAFHPPMVDQNLLVYADEAAFIHGLPADMQADAQARTQPPPFTIAEYLDLCTQLYDRYHDDKTHAVHIQVSPAGGQWCSDALIMASVEWAKARNTRVQMHMLETRYQRRYALKTWRKTFIRHLSDIGALGDWLTLAHMVWADADDFELLVDLSVGVAHNPGSNLRLRSGVAPLLDMANAGVLLGVGLDGHALDDDQDYWRELRLAWFLANNRDRSLIASTAEQVVMMAMRAGAAMTFPAAGLGALEVDAPADLQLIDFDAVRGAWAADGYPEPDDAFAFLLHRANKTHVRHVMVGGQWCVRDGVCVTLDEAAIAAEIRDALAAQDRGVLRQRRAAAQALALHIRRFYAGWEKY